jgi:site-specific recombinase XerD
MGQQIIHSKGSSPTALPGAGHLPALIRNAGHLAARRFIEFFTAEIRNPNTRRAYWRAVTAFFNWLEDNKLDELALIQPIHVAAYVEQLQNTHSKPSVKQHLAAIRMLFDYLVVGQVVPVNPASSVRGPRYVSKTGKTPVLSTEEARDLLESIPLTSVIGFRDRALIALMIYTFARVGAALTMRVEDFYPQGRRYWVRLNEKGGKRHELPCHHNLEEFLASYLDRAGIAADGKGPLFRTACRTTDGLTAAPMRQADVYRMIRRRARCAGIRTAIGCHTFRATGITAYLKNGGKIEIAQHMAAHESARTTSLYDRRGDAVTLDEVERIVI